MRFAALTAAFSADSGTDTAAAHLESIVQDTIGIVTTGAKNTPKNAPALTLHKTLFGTLTNTIQTQAENLNPISLFHAYSITEFGLCATFFGAGRRWLGSSPQPANALDFTYSP